MRGHLHPSPARADRVLNATARQPGRDFRVVTVSFDEKDTPAIAKMKRINYLKEMKRPFLPGLALPHGQGPSSDSH